MKYKDPKFFNLKDMILAAIIIALLVFTFIPVEEAEKESEVDKFGFESKEEEAEEVEVEEKENKYRKEEHDESVLRVFETSNDGESINMTPPDIDYENANKKIVLVGNGRGVLKSRKGEKIDNEHDIVGRFNFFVTCNTFFKLGF